MTLPVGAEGGPAYPTQRVEVPEGYHFEIMPLSFGRSRIVITDGVVNITEFW